MLEIKLGNLKKESEARDLTLINHNNLEALSAANYRFPCIESSTIGRVYSTVRAHIAVCSIIV
jgi:hypothetical protein